jgi:putative PIN family toxin of toxin-antitoxin system
MRPLALDTCVLISGLIGHGASVALVDAFFENRLALAYTPEILEEYAEVMERPQFCIESAERAAIFLKLRASAGMVDPAPVPSLRWPDPKDLPFVAAALATDQKTIVTLNQRDFVPAVSLGVTVLSPRQAVFLLRNST